ncbi:MULTISPECIES: hypothetical protein [Butyricimonas]|uniref:hypothetical protein n=1 Tax=Butyricimonas TaxID=574697 RepID=UPI00036C66D9|nr:MULTISPECIES: hypothetical protein [Butyricimonas]
MKTIQKLLERGRRDLKDSFFTAFYSWRMVVMGITFVLRFIKLPDFVPMILRGKSMEARHQLAFLLA